MTCGFLCQKHENAQNRETFEAPNTVWEYELPGQAERYINSLQGGILT